METKAYPKVRCTARVVLLWLVVACPAAVAQTPTTFHGAGLQKSCAGPAVCDPTGMGFARVGDTYTCTMRVFNVDDFGDSLSITSVTDVVHHGAGDVASGNLLTAPATLAPQGNAGDAFQVPVTDTVAGGDPAFLTDHATVSGTDLGTGQPISIRVGAGVNVVSCCTDADCDDRLECTVDRCVAHACQHAPAAAGSACTDRDGNQCTTPGCDGAGACNQKFGVQQQCVLTNCAIMYPFPSADPRTNVAFNESEVLRAFSPQGGITATPGLKIKAWYNDERALVLGVRQVNVKTAAGTTTTNYPVTPMSGNPSSATSPQVGTTALDGEQAGTDLSVCAGAPDLCDRPMFPALFITDTTLDATSKRGDWQSGGTPIPPSAVFGSWKGAVKTIDKTRSPAVVTVQPDADPAKNHWNLGAGDPPPPGLMDEGYGTEAVWSVDDLVAAGKLVVGHRYRLEFMVHDGDQNKAGGDTGENCVNLFLPAS